MPGIFDREEYRSRKGGIFGAEPKKKVWPPKPHTFGEPETPFESKREPFTPPERAGVEGGYFGFEAAKPDISVTSTPGEIAAFLANEGVLREVPPSLRDRFNASKRTGHTILTDFFIRTEAAAVGLIEEIYNKARELQGTVYSSESPAGGAVAASEIPTVARNAGEAALNATSRVVKELFHHEPGVSVFGIPVGVPGVKGERKLYPEFLRDVGIPEGPKASTIAPMLFHDHGKNPEMWMDYWTPEKDGPFDVTLRDGVGFGLSMFADPGSWIGAGPAEKVGRVLEAGQEIGTLAKLTKKGEVIAKAKYVDTISDAERFQLGLMRTTPIDDPLLDLIRTGGKTLEGSGQVPLRFKEGAEALAKESFGSKEGAVAALEAIRAGHRIRLSDKAMEFAREANLMADQIAMDAAHTHVANLVWLGHVGLVERGGLRFAGKTFQPFKGAANKAAAFLERISKRPIGEAIINGEPITLHETTIAGKVIKGIKAPRDAIDGIFSETHRAARNLPGVERSKAAYRADIRAADFAINETVEGWTKGWDKAGFVGGAEPTFFGKPVNLWEYLTLHLDDPARFPVDPLPGIVRQKIPQIRRAMDELHEIEYQRGWLTKQAYRDNYAPHYYDNPFEDMRLLGQDYLAPRGGSHASMVGAHGEMRAFPTFTDAMEYAIEKKGRGGIKFDLEPILDFREVMFRRMNGHARAVSMDDFVGRSLAHLGVAPKVVNREVFKRIWPEFDRILKEAEDLNIENLPITNETADQVGKALALMEEGKNADHIWAKMGPHGKALIIMGRLRRARDLEHVERILARNEKLIDQLDMGAVGEIRGMIGKAREEATDMWGSPYGPVRLQRVGAPREAAGLPKTTKKMEEEFWLPVAWVDELNRMQGKTRIPNDFINFLKRFDLLQDYWKSGVTVFFPSFHFRNYYNNVAQAFVEVGMAGVDPRMSARVHQVLAGAEGTMQTPWGKVTHRQLQDEMFKYGVLNYDDAIFERLTTPMRRRRVLDSKFVHWFRGKGQGIENYGLATIYLAHRKRGLTPVEAAWRTRRTLFEYDALSNFDRQVMRRLFPFWTWPRKNLVYSAEMLPQRWGRYNKLLKLDDRERGPDEEALPLYLRGDYKIRLEKEGKTTYITGIDMPLESAMEMVFDGGVINTLKTYANMINPALKSILELSMGHELLSGREIRRRQPLSPVAAKAIGGTDAALETLTDAEIENLRGFGEVVKKMAKPIRDWLGYKEVVLKDGRVVPSMNGTAAYLLFKSYFLSRLFSSTQKFRSDVSLMKATIQNLTGFGVEEFDETEAEERKRRNITRESQKYLQEMGELDQYPLYYSPERPAE